MTFFHIILVVVVVVVVVYVYCQIWELAGTVGGGTRGGGGAAVAIWCVLLVISPPSGLTWNFYPPTPPLSPSDAIKTTSHFVPLFSYSPTVTCLVDKDYVIKTWVGWILCSFPCLLFNNGLLHSFVNILTVVSLTHPPPHTPIAMTHCFLFIFLCRHKIVVTCQSRRC